MEPLYYLAAAALALASYSARLISNQKVVQFIALKIRSIHLANLHEYRNISGQQESVYLGPIAEPSNQSIKHLSYYEVKLAPSWLIFCTVTYFPILFVFFSVSWWFVGFWTALAIALATHLLAIVLASTLMKNRNPAKLSRECGWTILRRETKALLSGHEDEAASFRLFASLLRQLFGPDWLV